MLVIEVKKCLACKSCELSCALAHAKSKELLGAIKEGSRPGVKVEKAGEWSLPLQCRHCEEAPCVMICPTKAIKKMEAEEPVVIEAKLCIGCKFCVQACPFGVIFLKAGKGIIKCDLCVERLKKNQLPACVMSCPTKAIKFKLLEEVNAELRKKVGKELVAIIGKNA